MEIQCQYCVVCRRVRKTDIYGTWQAWRSVKSEDIVAKMEQVRCATCKVADGEGRKTRAIAVAVLVSG